MGISLCIVTRNEELYIGQAIESALPVVDEAVVVDTGSTDRTVEVARRAGARVYEEERPGDLGAAHDLPLAHASVDWILGLDGDEVIDPEGRDEIRRLCESSDLDDYYFTIRNYNYTPTTKWRDCDPRCWLDLGVLLQSGGGFAAALDAFRRADDLGRTADGAFHIGAVLVAMEFLGEALAYLHEALGQREEADRIRLETGRQLSDLSQPLRSPKSWR